MTITTPTAICLAHNLTLIAISILTGVALSLRVWTIPIIGLAQPASTATQVRQFNYIIALGLKYLQTSSRLLPVTLLSLAGATYVHHHNHLDDHQQWQRGEQVLAQEWTHYVAATLVLLVIAPWEIYLIFPINDRIAEYGKKLNAERQECFGDARDGEVRQLLADWQFWHVGRIVCPMAAALILAASGAGVL